VAQLADSISRLHGYAEEAGRDPAEIAIAYNASWSDGPGDLAEGERPLFSGSPEQVAGDIRTFEGMGVGHIRFGFDRPTLAKTLEHMERFVADVMPLV
jgi:alkanesulfonate monooxygenase SsuD/methylene tetrahydromethanopterin reductase-like flavin-dependent oxidoreductase (luciferase family)